MTAPGPAEAYAGSTAWSRNLVTPLRAFLHTETGGAAVLLAATLAALVWANVAASSYENFWGTNIAIDVGDWGVSLDLRGWVNSGLMTFYFFVVGLEARREFDLGELRERRRLLLPVVTAVAGMAAAVCLYLAFNAGSSSAHGWGIAMSTDTAFALGLLAVVGPRFPDRLRALMLTIVVVDDFVAVTVMAVVYTDELVVRALAVALGFFAAVLAARALRVRHGAVYFVLGLGMWVATLKSGIEPVTVGLAMGLLAYAYPAARWELERAGERFRAFREQPTPELARSVRADVRSAISPNERLQLLYHPWTSYAIVPLFALANAGITIDAGFLRDAFTSPVTLGILVGYVVGKPVGIVGGSWLVTRLSGGRVQLPVGWAAMGGTGTIAGIGFTVSLLVATLAFTGRQLDEAKVGILAAALCASVLSWLLFSSLALLPRRKRLAALLGSSQPLVDLAVDVDDERDHIRGPIDAPVTVVEYADYECPFCGRAEPVVRELLREFADVRYIWRHLPLTDVHPHAELAAEASEAAADQGAFWEMHDLLLQRQDALGSDDLIAYAEQLGLDVERFARSLVEHETANRVAEDVESAELSGVSGTPTFFINGRRHYGAYDLTTLSVAVHAAGARAVIATSR